MRTFTHFIGKSFATAILLLLPVVCFAGEQGEAEKLFASLKKKFDAMTDISLSFKQRVISGYTKNEQQMSGAIVIKKGNKFKLDLDRQVISTDGKIVWTLDKAENHFIIDNYKANSKALSPEKILSDLPDDFTPELLDADTLNQVKTSVLRLKPKGKGLYKAITFWIQKHNVEIRKIEILDNSNNLITYELSDVTMNSGVPDKFFILEAPEDAEIIDIR